MNAKDLFNFLPAKSDDIWQVSKTLYFDFLNNN